MARDNSKDPTPWAVICSGDAFDDDLGNRQPCGLVFLNHKQYMSQLSRPDDLWVCPKCGSTAMWDDYCQETNP